MARSYLWLGGAIMLAGLVGCSSGPGVRQDRVSSVTTTVDTNRLGGNDELTNTITAELEGWDERINDLKTQQLETRNKDRFDMLGSNIKDMEGKLQDARSKFFDFRTAETDGSREKYKSDINTDLKDLRDMYNKLPAE